MTPEEIKRRRQARGWTQEDLAREVGVGPRTIGYWESGSYSPKNKLGRLEAVLGEAIDTNNPLRTASEIALLAELLRRAEVRRAD